MVAAVQWSVSRDLTALQREVFVAIVVWRWRSTSLPTGAAPRGAPSTKRSTMPGARFDGGLRPRAGPSTRQEVSYERAGGVLRRLIGPAGADPGCDGSLETFELFLEADLAGQPAAEHIPCAAVHLEACPDCREDYIGLRDLVLAEAKGPATPG